MRSRLNPGLVVREADESILLSASFVLFGLKSPVWLKMVSAAGVAPAVAPSRTEHVAATPRAVCPGVIRKDAGDLFFVGSESLRPWTATRGEIRSNSERGTRSAERAQHRAGVLPRCSAFRIPGSEFRLQIKLARRLGAAPSGLSFGDSAARAGARRVGIG